MDEIPFRHCAMMLKVEPYYKLKPKKIEPQKIEKLNAFLEEELSFFDNSYAPQISLAGEISLPVKAISHLSLKTAAGDERSFFELGFVSQQALLYLAYLKLKYCLVFMENSLIVPFSSDGSPMHEGKVIAGFARVSPFALQKILFFEKWGVHPEDFLKENPKLESIMRYCRYAPVINGSERPRFIMNKESMHLITVSEGSQLSPADLVNAGFILFNYIFSARLLGLKGEWKLLREIDRPDKQLFDLPDKAVHIATWHGQLF